jgi:uncharacterized protein YdhG (YjbR/CyaY superfamily)
MQAVRKNNIEKLRTMCRELELNDLENAISCVMTREFRTGNTILHIANNENIYSILFGVFWFSKDTNQLLKFVTQTNALNETPLVNAVKQNNAKMVNMLLNVVKKNSPQYLISYVMKRTHIFSKRPFDLAFSYDDDSRLKEIFIEICQKYGTHFTLINYFMDTMKDFENILHKAAHAKDTKLFLFIINVFLRTKEHEKLLHLLSQHDMGQNTALHNLIGKRHFSTLNMILHICKKLANKEQLMKLTLLKHKVSFINCSLFANFLHMCKIMFKVEKCLLPIRLCKAVF